MKKRILRFMVAICLAFGIISATGGSIGPVDVVTTAYAAPGDEKTDTNSTTGGTGDEKGIKGDEDANLNITLDENGNLTGGITNKGTDGKGGTIDTGNKILETLSLVFTLVLAAAAIVLAIIFVVHCVSLAKDGNNPQGKSSSINGLIMTAVAAILCGGSAVFMGMFFNVFR